jgi:hypothetical protein
MKFRMILASAALACVGFGTPALAQEPAPQAEAVLQEYIASHPEVRRNPSLLSDPGYLSGHPEIAHFLRTHPYVRRQTLRMGAWDTQHQWRDPDWWHENDPDWAYNNHPEWIQSHPNWMNDGDYDDTHHWRSRDWWRQNHPNWVREHHPHWAQAHGYGADADEHHHHGNAYGHDKDHDHGHGND